MAGRGRWRRPCAARRTAIGVALALALGGACAGPVSIEEFEAATGVAAPVQPVVAPTTTIHIPEQFRELVGEAAPVTDMSTGFGDGARVATTGLAVLGSERALVEVVLYDGYGIVVGVAPNGDVDRVVVRGGGAEQPSPLPTAMVNDPEGARFAATDLDWGIVPGLVDRTPVDLDMADAKVSHVIVEKNLPFSPELVIRVYVSGPRASGRIDYFADGRLMRAFPG